MQVSQRNCHNTVKVLCYMQCGVWLAYTLTLGLMYVYNLKDEEFVYGLCIFLGFFTVWSLYSWYLVTGYFFDLYSLLLVSLIMFSGGQAILEIFGLNPHGILGGQHPVSTVKDCLRLVVTCLMAFHSGGMLRAYTFKFRNVKPFEQPARAQVLKSLREVGVVMIFASLAPAGYVLYETVSIVADSGYGGLYQQSEIATGVGAWYVVLAAFLLPGALLLLGGSQGRHFNIVLCWALIFIPATIHLMTGARNFGLQALAALLWLHSTAIKPINRLVIAIGLVIAVLSIPVIGSSRADRLAPLDDKVTAFQRALQEIENPFVPVLKEMGQTLQTILYTVELVPGIRPHEWGEGYLFALSTVIPNLFWDLHPADQRGLPSIWLTNEISPEMRRVGYGLGYSMIAEAYLNFSWMGAPVVIGLIGFAVAHFVLQVLNRLNPLLVAIEAILITFTLFLPRAESLLFIRPLVWQCLFPYLVVRYITNRNTVHLRLRSLDLPHLSRTS